MSSVAFVIPKIVDNLDGWGPSTIPEQFKELPYKPFNKGDKISKAADWTQTTNTGKQYQDDEDDFILVDNQPKQKLKKKKNLTQFQKRMHRIQAQQQQRRIQQQNLLQNPPAKQNKAKKMQQRPRGNYSKNYDNKRSTESSIEIQPEWEQVTQIDLANLGKLVSSEYEVEDVELRGELFYLDSAYIAGISTKTEKLLEKTDKSNPRITTSDDPVIRDLVLKGEGDIFATDSILNLLGASPHILNAWDIIVQRIGSKLILDKREKSQIDMITVNAPQDMFHDTSDQINSPLGLSQEATHINQHFPIQVLKKDADPVSFDKPNPFKSADHSPVAYRYRKWSLDNGFDLVARCELDAAKRTNNGIQYITVRALNQYDPKIIVDWRQKLDTQEAAILASELKNNHSKLVKWAVQAILSGTDQVVIGYVVRTSPKDKNHHTVLAVKTYNTLEFANLIGVKAENVFGILDALTNSFMRLPEGKYLLAKDPNTKNIASLYKLPPGALEEESADEDNEETDEIEGEDKE